MKWPKKSVHLTFSTYSVLNFEWNYTGIKYSFEIWNWILFIRLWGRSGYSVLSPPHIELHLLDNVSWHCPDVTFSMSLVQSVQSHLLVAHYFSLCKINWKRSMPDLSVTQCYNTLLPNLVSTGCRHLVPVNTTEAGDWSSVYYYKIM